MMLLVGSDRVVKALFFGICRFLHGLVTGEGLRLDRVTMFFRPLERSLNVYGERYSLLKVF